MPGVKDYDIFADYEEAERRNPSDRKVINEERTIHRSRGVRHPRAHAYGQPILCDFGEARVVHAHKYSEIQPEIYKAPEILMQFDWHVSVEVWSAACLARNVFIVDTGHDKLTNLSFGSCWRPSICSMVLTMRDSTTTATT